MKWPDTFLIESSGRRDNIDAALEAKKLRQNKAKLRNRVKVNNEKSITTLGPEDNTTEEDLTGKTSQLKMGFERRKINYRNM